MDRGTENTKIAAVQFSFREDHSDEYAGTRSIRFGTSPANIVSYNKFNKYKLNISTETENRRVLVYVTSPQNRLVDFHVEGYVLSIQWWWCLSMCC